ncbi:AbgT family transporter [Corynebacterium pseudodiphtheriticum]|uniref:AbgT family transporter n=1 Tax=Corynebacterium pseudodiphtheriticum TaxID=37637 RepID=UPI002550E626|nr:AbgT family transporter [Corynebacterium pseudodiphtheriticum]MDK8578876.1 AbgT family transporter [Corynebacterium pseudodiphtheriticum]MDK8614501.1 AbgT family transporter [Corynebacterium pseudodiphtheriticum]MDK8701181.1 AbgT family transporter [Corynebacterium pseudodiphtheriticum]MDK8718251.1 AbgT family transporter [Corynebacterium pseudodiphtheriticum]MDK8738439.1 AbgT family transporter [Corynebacterium pseudodiphtheriticum]
MNTTAPHKSATKKKENQTDADSGDKTTGSAGGFLGLIEKIGNKLPNPFWLFVILAGIVALSSWLGSTLGMKATQPDSGEIVAVENLLTTEGIQRMVTEAVDNFTSFPPLGVILTVMLGVAVAEHSGLLSALVRSMVAKVGPKVLTFTLALAGVTGSVASDAVYVILIPLGAMSFHALGRSPIVGAMVAFAASSAGFNSSLILNITDLLLASISTPAAQLVDENYDVSPLANIFFVIPSAIVLALIITAVTELFVNKRAHDLVDHDKIDYSEVSFDNAAGASNTSGADEPTGSADSAGNNENNDNDENNTEDISDQLKLAAHEKSGLRATGIALLLMLLAYFALLFIPGSPLTGPDGEIMDSPLIRAIAVPIAGMFFLCGIVYGLVAKSITSSADIPDFMAAGLKTMLPMIVLFFAVAQFLAWFEWSNLGVWTAITGSELLERADLPPILLFAGVVALVALLNLFITSGSAQWALMAPVLVPMLMYVGTAPEVTQMLFRIGDSPTNIITPMSPYFALALTFLQRYYKRSGVGTLMSLALPYSIAMIIGWFIFFMIWYFLGIPLGPGSPMEYPAN